MVEVKGLKELMQGLKNINKKALRDAARKGALAVAKEITKEYKKNVPKQTGLLKQSVRAVASRSLEKGVYRAASVVFRMKKVSQKRYEVLKSSKYTQKRRNDKKQRMEYFASAYYAHFVEYGFYHKAGQKKGKNAPKRFIKGTFSMRKARDKIAPNANFIIEAKLNAELSKLGF